MYTYDFKDMLSHLQLPCIALPQHKAMLYFLLLIIMQSLQLGIAIVMNHRKLNDIVKRTTQVICITPLNSGYPTYGGTPFACG